jgi:hypothetical protein
MNIRADILEELEALQSTLAKVDRANVYIVPTNYFDNFYNDLSDKITASALTENTANPYEVPATYFEKLSGNILSKIKAEDDVHTETAAISTTVASIGNANVYSMPADYFTKLSFVKEKPKAKIISFNFLKYAAAAVVVGLLGLGLYNFFMKPSSAMPNAELAIVMQQADKIIKANSFDATLATISDKDLEQYLVQEGENLNASLVATTAEDATLPDAIDYSLDPNTLDDFLSSNNIKN